MLNLNDALIILPLFLILVGNECGCKSRALTSRRALPDELVLLLRIFPGTLNHNNTRFSHSYEVDIKFLENAWGFHRGVT